MRTLSQQFREAARAARTKALGTDWSKIDRDTYRRTTGEVVERTASGWRVRGESMIHSSWHRAIRSVDFGRAVAGEFVTQTRQ